MILYSLCYTAAYSWSYYTPLCPDVQTGQGRFFGNLYKKNPLLFVFIQIYYNTLFFNAEVNYEL